MDKEFNFQKFSLIKMNKSPDRFTYESWSAVHKLNTLTPELWWYSAKSIDSNSYNVYEIFTCKPPSCEVVLKIISLDVGGYLKNKMSVVSECFGLTSTCTVYFALTGIFRCLVFLL